MLGSRSRSNEDVSAMESGEGGGVAESREGRPQEEQRQGQGGGIGESSPEDEYEAAPHAEAEQGGRFGGGRYGHAWVNSRQAQEWCNLLLLGLVVGFAAVFTYAWVEAFRKGVYDQAIGFITVAFFAIATCTRSYRRRMRRPTVVIVEEETAHAEPTRLRNFVDQWAHHQPKGVPRHVRQTFDYFIFTAAASPTDKEKDEEVKRPGGNPPGTAGSTPLPSAPVAPSHRGQPDADAGVETARPFVGAADGSPTAEQAQKAAAAAAAATTAEPAIGVDEGKRDGSGAASAPSSEKETQQQLQQGKFAWASSSALTDCSVCLEAYRNGDRVCRLPCAHAFHASCINTWLDQQHVCPQCRLDLLPPELSWGQSSQASATTTSGNPTQFANLFGSLERMILASHQSVAGGGYSGSAIATHGAQGQETGPAAAGSPYASIFGSPAYGASPLPTVTSVAHQAWPSPEFFSGAGGNGSSSQHRSVRASASIAGSPTDMPGPFHAHFQMQQQRQHQQQLLLLQQQHYLASPAFTDGSPPSTASSAVLVHPRGRTSPRFTTLGGRARGTPVPNGVGRFGMFPAVMRSVSFAAPDGSTIGSGGVGESGVNAGAARLGIPPTPPRGRHPSTGGPQVSSVHHNYQFRPVVAAPHHHPHQQQQHHDHQTRGGDQQPTAANAVGAEPTGAAVAGVAPQGHSAAAPAPASASTTTVAVAAPSPPPLLRLSPRRPRMAVLGRGARPSTPVMCPAITGFPAGGNGGGACDDDEDGGGGGYVGQPFMESCGAGTRTRSGSVPIGRPRSGSGHRRLRIPSLHGGRRRLRSRSNSYDVVPTSRSGSPGMFVLGNASPKAGCGGGGVVERKASGAFWGSKGRPSSRRPQGMASWDEVDDDVSDIFTRCRPGSEDWGGSGDWQPDAFERSFRNGPSIAPTSTEQQHGPANLRAAAAATTTTTTSHVGIVSENADGGKGAGGGGGSRELPRPPCQQKRQAAEQQQQQQERSRSQQHREDHQQQQQQQHGDTQRGQEPQQPPPRQQQHQLQQEEGQERLAPHFHLSFDDETSESEQGGGSGDEDHDSDSNDSSSYADSEELEGVEAGETEDGGRPRGRGPWSMLYCQ
ncbi:unnamed protein product [Ectocarpus sp. CCAP 1310/34]|nr:unnamed protein product [Ectocarpus sp. CCAP 1310/34]